jgi:hypothetical protein
MTLRAGDWIEVRSKEEILRSLDKRGCLEELPFMPQMFQYCGRRFQVYKRAHKTCDTVNPIAGRRLENSVHLELRCDGKAYGGCQAACLIFWKEEWLKPTEQAATSIQATSVVQARSDGKPSESNTKISSGGCTEDDVLLATCVRGQRVDDTRYTCQATQLPYFTAPLSPWDIRQYIEDLVSGNVSFAALFRGIVYLSYYHLTLAKRWGRSGRPARWLYDKFQVLIGGVPFPRRRGTLAAGQATPTVDLNLQPGELVRVKSYKEILATLDGLKNRGMLFDAELVPYCGGVYRVRARVTNFIDEKTGKMSSMKTPAVILEGVWCQSRYSNCRMFCPRSIYSWWREVWLERAPEKAKAETLALGRVSEELVASASLGER